MSRATPQMLKFARSLIAYETSDNETSGTKTPAGFHVYEKLHPHLATLMGNGGFRALLTRALTLASAEVPAMRAVQVKADGTLDGLEELYAQLDSDKLFEGRVVLLAQLLDLLVAFIGENLTLRLLRDAWPKVSFNDLDSNGGDKHENNNFVQRFGFKHRR